MRLSFSCLFLSPLPFFFYKYIVKLPIIQNDWTQTVRSNTLESCDPCSPILSLVFFAALLRALKKKKGIHHRLRCYLAVFFADR